jgi:actin-like ATPase involved in cell morphogenesis
LTTFGIFATFVGIAIGLINFDEQDVQASVPALLAGLKTAFLASVAGVGGALTLKFRHYFIDPEQAAEAESGIDEDVSAEDLAKLLKEIQWALIGDGESSLAFQLKLSRLDTNERLDSLKAAQVEAMRKLSEMGSKQITEALRDVIKDFNEKLSEQFGENFKQLNDGVGKMLTWQEQYKEHIELVTSRHIEIVDSMKDSVKSYKDLVDKAESFTNAASQLSSLLSALDTQRRELAGSLEALGSLFVAASGSLPQIEAKIMELTNQLTKAVEHNQQEINKSLAESATRIQAFIQEAATKSTATLESQHAYVNSALIEGVDLVKGFTEETAKNLERSAKIFNSQLSETSEQIKKQVTTLDVAISDKLQKALESLGRKLAASPEKSHL